MLRQRSRPQASRPAGFSLLEVVIVLVILVVLVVLGSNMISQGVDVAKRANQDSAALTQTRTAVERITRELREVSWSTAAGAYEISVMQGSRAVFIRRLGTVATTVTIEYLPATQQLTLLASGLGLTQPQILLSEVTSFQFTYYDRDHTVTANPARLRMIQIALEQGSTNPPSVFRTHVGLRNFE